LHINIPPVTEINETNTNSVGRRENAKPVENDENNKSRRD